MNAKNFLEDTISAIATPPGKGAIGVIKISGKDALSVLKKIFKPAKPRESFESHKLYYGFIIDSQGKVIDEVLVTYMKAPRTYTREDVVEIYAHSGYLILRKIFELILLSGARQAKPGEFTLRAFLNGRIDLAQAEAIEELISAKSEEALDLALKNLFGGISEKVNQIKSQILEVLVQVETAIDFPEEDVEIMQPEELKKKIENEILPEIDSLIKAYNQGRIYKEGISLVIAGKPNAGKSSLMNALLKEERAIVTPIPGTTRDFLEEEATIEGIPVKLIDTAGLRETEDPVEKIGVEIAKKKFKEADLILFLIDTSEPVSQEVLKLLEEVAKFPHLVVLNKIDIKNGYLKDWRETIKGLNEEWIEISVKTGTNLDLLAKKVVEKILGKEKRDVPQLVPTLRQKVLLEKAKNALKRALEALSSKEPLPELVAVEVRDALSELSEIVGEVTSEDVLSEIFSKFCIGK